MKVDQDIFATIYPICRDVEAEVVGQGDRDLCVWWGKKNALRHTVTIESILNYARRERHGVGPLKILNMSGLSCGHQDFSICHYLQKQKEEFVYYAIEHPNSPYLKLASFTDRTNEARIRTVSCDLRTVSAESISQEIGQPNIILFTEIAEHLEHSTLLRCLQTIAQLLPTDGRLLLSTPNCDSLECRVKHWLGQELDYWGDGKANLEAGLWGHIVYYNTARLRRLLRDAGLSDLRLVTFNFPFPHPKTRGVARPLMKSKTLMSDSLIWFGERAWRVPFLMNMLKTLGDLIYLEAGKAPIRTIPFAL